MKTATVRAAKSGSPRVFVDRRPNELPETKSAAAQVIRLLPLVRLSQEGGIDIQQTPVAVLASLAEGAAEVVGAMTRGTSVIGRLVAECAPQLEDGSVGLDGIEALGWCISELGALTAACVELEMLCRSAAGASGRGGGDGQR